MDQGGRAAITPPLTRWQKIARWTRVDRFRLYMLPGYGITYRIIMRVAHRYGWHYAPRRYSLNGPQRWAHHCQWCGLRGETLNMDRIRADAEASGDGISNRAST